MRIRRTRESDPPEINLIPLIDILLVIVIFLVVSTSFVRQSHLKVELPGVKQAQTEPKAQDPIRVRIGKDGNYSVGSTGYNSEPTLRAALAKEVARFPAGSQDIRAVLEADAAATHQSVVTVMDMLAGLGVARVSIATASSR